MQENILTNLSKRPIFRILIVIFPVFIFIFADVVCENFISVFYNRQTENLDLFLLSLFCFLQIIAAPIQSSFSDAYGRKKGLVFSLFFSLLSLVFLYTFNLKEINNFTFLIFATISKGIFGNTLPIALAVIADTRYKNYRLLFAFATAAYAFAYLALSYTANPVGKVEQLTEAVLDSRINLYLIAFFVLVIIFCLLLRIFKNKEDSHQTVLHTFKAETRLLKQDVKHPPTRKALTAFFLWEISLYSILLSQVDFRINKPVYIAEFMMVGYLIGVVILIFSYRLKDSKVIQFGYWLSFLSLVPYFTLFKIVEDQASLLRACCFFHALGNAFLSPSLLSILAKGIKARAQGRMYGLTDSVDTLAYWFGTLAIILIIRVLKLDLVYLILFSFLVFAYSWKFYNRFQETQER